MAFIPRQNDVLFGKGTAINTHHGNKRYRSIVELQKSIFLTSKRTQKREIATNLVHEIKKTGGRFLMEDPNNSNSKSKTKGGVGGVDPQFNLKSSVDDDHGRVTDALILTRVWVLVEDDKAIEKVMHRLREKRASAGKLKQPTDEEKLELRPPPPPGNNTSSKAVGTMDLAGMAAWTKLDAKPSSHPSSHYGRQDEANIQPRQEVINEMASNILGHHNMVALGNGTNSTMNTFGHTSVSRRIQPTLQPIAQQTPSMQGSMQGSMHGTTPVPVPFALKYWITSIGALLPQDEYTKSATILACMLVKRLIQIVASANMPPDEFSTEKIIVFVQQNASKLLIKEVRFHFETRGALFPPPLHSTSFQVVSGGSPLQSRTFCALLGNLLLEIFTMGRSSALEISSNNGTSNNNYGLSGVTPPPLKRRAVVPTSDSIIVRAKRLLAESGMPLSICRLVCDLLGAANEPRCPDSNLALTSLDDALWDLTQMTSYPRSFLFDRTCPLQAMVDTHLFTDTEKEILFGRKREMGVLLKAKRRIADHVLTETNVPPGKIKGEKGLAFAQEINVRQELIVLTGYAGSGKSSMLHSLVHSCNKDGWFVLRCKYDKQSAPIQVLSRAFDDFFGMWVSKINEDRAYLRPATMQSFKRLCDSIEFSIDEEGLQLLFPTIPNLVKIFPQAATSSRVPPSLDQDSSFIGSVGSQIARRMNLFHVLFKSLCSSGRPALIIHDDLQWAKSLEGMREFLVNYVNIGCGDPCGDQIASHGILLVGAFRSNEKNDGFIKTVNSIEQSEKAKVTKLAIGELAQDDIGKLLSAKLCLPIRYTKKLAELVSSKSGGNPFFIVQFLKSIIENRMLGFSIDEKRWMWDCDVIDMKMISDEVAQLLTTRFNQLPLLLIQTVKIVSCFGSQVDESMLGLLNLGEDVLHMAINEGLMEKAGPIYQFTHDLIQQTIYDLIPLENRKILHKSIGRSLLQSGYTGPAVHVLAVDQINISCEGAALSSEERSSFAKINVTAAKFAIAASSFEKARSYIDAGMNLLEPQHWEKQYSLCLQLHEMSASVSYMHGDVRNMSIALNEIMDNVKSFEDGLRSSSLLVKLLASSAQYKEAMSNCLAVLSNLGEEISTDVSLPIVRSELSVIQTTLANISVEQVQRLPRMTDKSKLNAMQFLSMLCMYSLISKPMLLPLFSCRMVRMTIEYGFCDASIVGLSTAAFGLFTFTDDILLGYRIGKVCDSLIDESPNRHALRSRLCRELDCSLKVTVEPNRTVVPLFIDRYNSAMMTGDVESALLCLLAYCTGSFYIGTNLVSLTKTFKSCIEQAANYQQTNALHVAMSNFRAVLHLTGRSNVEVGIKSYEELEEIGKNTNSQLLLRRILMSQMGNHFYDRNWVKVMELFEKKPPSKFNNVLVIGRALYGGVASLTLARQTHELKWRRIGEEAVEKMTKYEKVSSANFSWVAKLLRAELHYLNGNLELSEATFKASIRAARDNQCVHNEALVHELYGIFCIENEMVDNGAKQLQMALEKYKQWGATNKVNDLQMFIDIVDPTSLRALMNTPI